MDLWQLILVIAGAGVVLEQLWLKVVVRLYRLFKYGERHVLVDAVLLEIAEQFKPNGGSSLYDQIQFMQGSIDNNRLAVEALDNKFDIFILGRVAGGDRSTDPSG